MSKDYLTDYVIDKASVNSKLANHGNIVKSNQSVSPNCSFAFQKLGMRLRGSQTRGR
jgi:hypothetical protein